MAEAYPTLSESLEAFDVILQRYYLDFGARQSFAVDNAEEHWSDIMEIIPDLLMEMEDDFGELESEAGSPVVILDIESLFDTMEPLSPVSSEEGFTFMNFGPTRTGLLSTVPCKLKENCKPIVYSFNSASNRRQTENANGMGIFHNDSALPREFGNVNADSVNNYRPSPIERQDIWAPGRKNQQRSWKGLNANDLDPRNKPELVSDDHFNWLQDDVDTKSMEIFGNQALVPQDFVDNQPQGPNNGNHDQELISIQA